MSMRVLAMLVLFALAAHAQTPVLDPRWVNASDPPGRTFIDTASIRKDTPTSWVVWYRTYSQVLSDTVRYHDAHAR